MCFPRGCCQVLLDSTATPVLWIAGGKYALYLLDVGALRQLGLVFSNLPEAFRRMSRPLRNAAEMMALDWVPWQNALEAARQPVAGAWGEGILGHDAVRPHVKLAIESRALQDWQMALLAERNPYRR